MDLTNYVYLKFATWIVTETSLKGGHIWVSILVFQVELWVIVSSTYVFYVAYWK
jgi:hypothetical protein